MHKLCSLGFLPRSVRTVFCIAVLTGLLASWPVLAHSGDNEAFNASAESAEPEEVVVDDQGIRALGLELSQVKKVTLNSYLEATGEVRAAETQSFDVNPPVSGVVKAVYSKQGDTVRKNQTLALVHSIEVADTLTRLLNDRTKIDADIARVQTQLKSDMLLQNKQVQITKVTLDREEGLVKEGISAKKNFHESKNAYESALVKQNALDVRLEQEVKLLEKQRGVTIKNAKGQLKIMGMTEQAIQTALTTGVVTADLPLTAPVAGVITTRSITLGQRVNIDDTVFSIVNLSPIWVMIDVYQEQIPRVREGQKVWIKTPSKQEVEGVISSVGSVVEATTKTLKVRIVAENRSHILRPGMFVAAQIITGHGSKESFVVPESAIVYFKERPYVYERHEDHFEPLFIKTGLKTSQGVEVETGLSGGENIVVSGAQQLQAQTLLKPGSGHTHEEKEGHEEHHDDDEHGEESKKPANMLIYFFGGVVTTLAGVGLLAFFILRSRKNGAQKNA